MTPDCFYKILLNLYPRDFRNQYGDEMTRVFQESLCNQGSSIGFWIRVIWDAISSAFKIQLNTMRGGFMRTTLVKFGAVCGVAFGLNIAWIGITSPLFTTPSWIESTIWNTCSIFLFLAYALLRHTRPNALEIAGYATLLISLTINMLPVESHGSLFPSFLRKYFNRVCYLLVKTSKAHTRFTLPCFKLGWVESSSHSVGLFGPLQIKTLPAQLEP